ncbi:MAG: PepSY domain-containing protein [Pyrinomonadaceae bacterium]
MKKYTLFMVGLFVSVGFAGGIVANPAETDTSPMHVIRAKITLEQARKNALKKIEGKVEDEYSLEDDDGKTTSYVFIIKRKDAKRFEVEIDAEDGKVLSAEEIEEGDTEGEPQG